MEEKKNKEPTTPEVKTPEVKKKEWYMNWWGVVIAILFLPLFGIWWIWNKTKASNKIKWVLTGLIALLIVVGVVSTGSNNSTTNTASPTETPTQTQQTAQPKKEEPKEDTSDLKAEIKKAYDVPGIEVTNLETVAWDECEIKLNGDYERTIRNPLQPNSPLNNPYPLFTKSDGTRFNPDTTAVKNVVIKCKINGNTRYGAFRFHN